MENLQQDNRVVVCYANMSTRFASGFNGFLRFYGTAEIFEEGAIKNEIFSGLTKREQEHQGADTGVAVLIKIERSGDALVGRFNESIGLKNTSFMLALRLIVWLTGRLEPFLKTMMSLSRRGVESGIEKFAFVFLPSEATSVLFTLPDERLVVFVPVALLLDPVDSSRQFGLT